MTEPDETPLDHALPRAVITAFGFALVGRLLQSLMGPTFTARDGALIKGPIEIAFGVAGVVVMVVWIASAAAETYRRR